MTDPMLPPDDEIVSAVLDGEASADERARVDADPAARARLAHFGEVRRQVAAPVTIPSDARERALAAALGAFDAAASSTSAGAPVRPAPPSAATPTADAARPTGPVDELAARRARPGRGVRVLAAAAAVVVVLIGVGAVIRSTERAEQVATGAADSRDAQTTSEAPQSADQEGVTSGAPENGPVTSTTRAPGVVPSTAPATTSSTVTDPTDSASGSTAAGPLVELGTVSSSRQLRTLVLAGVDERSERQSGSSTAYDSRAVAGGPTFVACADVVHGADPEVGTVLLSANATYEGEPTIVLAFAIDRAAHPAANGSVRIYALDAATCTTRSVQTVR